MRLWPLVVLVFATTACDPVPPPPQYPVKITESEVRTDLAPILTEFPKLPKIRSVVWLARQIGDPREPGPNDYDLEAVIHLENPADLPRDGWTAAEPDWAKRVSPKLADQVAAPAPWVRSDAFDHAFASTTYPFRNKFVVQLSKGVIYHIGGTT